MSHLTWDKKKRCIVLLLEGNKTSLQLYIDYVWFISSLLKYDHLNINQFFVFSFSISPEQMLVILN